MSFSKCGVLLAVVCLARIASPVMAIDGTPIWFSSFVASPGANSYVSSPVLAFDHYGSASIGWTEINQNTSDGAVRHSQMTGLGLWNTRTLITGNDVGKRAALSFDRSERPLLAWINGDGSVQGQFNYGANQSIAGTGAANAARPNISLTYDLAGTARGYFGGTTTGNFRSIGHTGSAFTTADMLSLSGVTLVHDSAMSTDGQGRRHFIARGNLAGGGQGVLIASEPAGGGAWSTATLTSDDAIGGVDIARDPTDGRMALAYTTLNSGTNTSKLFYAKFTGSFLQTTEVLSSTTEQYRDVALAFDLSDGRPAIAYENFVNSNSAQRLLMAYLTGAMTWQHSLVDDSILHDAPNNHARRPSLAFDDYGTSWPAIAYIDSNGALTVAFDPPAPEPATAVLLLLGGLGIAAARRKKTGDRPLWIN
ncbi:MAG: hypothetical protein HBSAPP02_13500 [Phycisphaerae bacterium]|nr:MAG: PEP-CTERM sorting domain-containing protein [Planctomycetia bacterium]RIK70635.1 MAG: hypothetical protein DCC66_04980 [Planctomycetota bacterium]GJQ26318.1 MAG: hypothetical protein HBSAPP02_13500 [Phycisphaerae bacterium]